MATTRGHADTHQANRLITRLGRHWGHKFAVILSDTELTVPFSEEAQAHLIATEDGLDIRIQHPDADQLTRLQQVVAEHLQRFAKDQTLAFTWQ